MRRFRAWDAPQEPGEVERPRLIEAWDAGSQVGRLRMVWEAVSGGRIPAWQGQDGKRYVWDVDVRRVFPAFRAKEVA